MKILRIVFLVFVMMACTKENDNYRSVGIITGIDGTMCGCSQETFPITVKLDWQLVNNGCRTFNRITVQRIKKI